MTNAHLLAYNLFMTEKQKRIAKLFTVVGVILMLIAIVALVWNIVTLAVRNSHKSRLEETSRQLQAVIDGNEEDIDYKSSKEFVEKYARDYLNMKYPDETVYAPSNDSDKEEEK